MDGRVAAGCYAGVDVSKGRLDAAVCPTGETLSVANDPEGVEELVC